MRENEVGADINVPRPGTWEAPDRLASLPSENCVVFSGSRQT